MWVTAWHGTAGHRVTLSCWCLVNSHAWKLTTLPARCPVQTGTDEHRAVTPDTTLFFFETPWHLPYIDVYICIFEKCAFRSLSEQRFHPSGTGFSKRDYDTQISYCRCCGIHFTKILWVHNEKILDTIVVLIMIVIKRSGHKFAYVTTWHVQNVWPDLSFFKEEQQEFYRPWTKSS